MHKHALFAATAAVLALVSAQASAGAISGTFSGIVTNSQLFGSSSGNIDGTPLTGTFSTSFANCGTLPFTSACFVPQMLVTFALANHSYSFTNSGFETSAFDFVNTAAGQTLVLEPDFGDPHGNVLLNLAGPVDAFVNNNDPNTLHPGPVFASLSTAFIALRFDIVANLQLTSVHVDNVPEPATWSMLFAGFGMIGFAARRRRTTAVTA